jgi:leader peptidase (prepilin peptidase)/N-methyltransferase
MIILISIYCFFTGLAFGSFALAMVDRMHTGRDWVKGRSECESCHETLIPIDLIPVFSWLSTGGKCRYCKVKLSHYYPAVEIALGVAFLYSYVQWPYELVGVSEIARLIVWLLSLVILTALVIFDFKWFLLPNKLVYPLILLSAVWALLAYQAADGSVLGTLVSYGLSVAVSSGLFYALYMVSSGKWIGDGDIRLGVAIGLFTGSILQSWAVILLASLLGIVFSLPLLVKKGSAKKKRNLQIPFGPMLILALFIIVLHGQQIIDWYKMDILLL